MRCTVVWLTPACRTMVQADQWVACSEQSEWGGRRRRAGLEAEDGGLPRLDAAPSRESRGVGDCPVRGAATAQLIRLAVRPGHAFGCCGPGIPARRRSPAGCRSDLAETAVWATGYRPDDGVQGTRLSDPYCSPGCRRKSLPYPASPGLVPGTNPRADDVRKGSMWERAVISIPQNPGISHNIPKFLDASHAILSDPMGVEYINTRKSRAETICWRSITWRGRHRPETCRQLDLEEI